MTPTSTRQSLLIWSGALALSVLLSFLSGIATHWPEGGPIDWRGVMLDVIQTVLSVAPVVAAGIGLPQFGKEAVTSLVKQIGTDKATDVLAVEAIRQDTGVVSTPIESTLSDEDIGRLADRLVAEYQARQIAAAGGRS